MAEESKKSKRFELKIIHAGFHRGGTGSVAIALDMLGCGPVWHLSYIDFSLMAKGINWWLKDNSSVFKKLDNDNWNDMVDFDEWLQIIKCPTIMDLPTVLYADKIFAQYPNCKVIVPCFDFKKWYPSMVFVTNIAYSWPFTLASYFLGGCKMAQKDYWPRLFNYNVDKFLNDKQWAEQYYQQRLKHIKKIIPEKQLLIYDVRDGWEPLCKFLNKPIPKEPFPRANTRKTMNKIVYTIVAKAVISKTFWFACGAILAYSGYKYYKKYYSHSD